MNSFLKYSLFCLLMVLGASIKGNAQLGFCTGNSGDPIFVEDFGVAPSAATQHIALPLPGTTTYGFLGSPPGVFADGLYTVSNMNYQQWNWFNQEDHTIGDQNGRMLVVNASFTAGEFYRLPISGLCENTTYEFSSWLMNLTPRNLFNNGSLPNPCNVSFEIWDSTDTTLLKSGTTGDFLGSLSTQAGEWLQFALVFQTQPAQNSVILKMVNNGVGGYGNDVAIDDIIFKSCGDSIELEDNSNNNSISICSNQTPYATTLSAIPDNSVFSSHFYQWQESSDGGITWVDIAGETNSNLTISGLTTQTYYRAKIAEDIVNVNNSSCNTVSDVFEISIDMAVTPTFTQVSDICNGDTLNPLPTTSNEGITGTWSPILDNNATTTYTFTPDSGQCATNQTMTITVNPIVTPTFTQVSAICDGGILNPLPTVSNEGIAGAWSPALDNTATTTYTFTPNSGQCATNQTMTITVNPIVTPTFTQVSAICNGDILNPLPTASAEGITGNWSPALDNTATTIYTFTPDSGQCASNQTMTITVNPIVTPTFTQVPDICNGDTLSPLPTTSNEGITGTWSPTLDNTSTTTYTFTPNSGECAINQTMTITVNPIVIPTFTQVPDICNGDTLNPLPTTSNEGITGTWSPVLDNTSTTVYTFTPDLGQCASNETMTITVNAAVIPIFTQISPICSGETLSPLPIVSNNGVTGTWSPAVDNTSTTTYTFVPDIAGCITNQTMTIAVNPIVTPTFTQVADICNGDTLNPLPTTSIEGITGTWSPALDNTSTTTYTFAPDLGQCATSQTMTVNVNAGVIPTFTQVQPICFGEMLSPLPTVSNNGVTGAWNPSIDNTTTTTYTFTPDPGFCPSNVNMTILVNDNPIFSLQEEYFLCFGSSGNIAQPLSIDTGLSTPDYSFTWLLNSTPLVGETEGRILPLLEGEYEVIVENTTTLCESTSTMTVTALFEPVYDVNITSEVFSPNQSIEVVTTSAGIFEYKLDNGSWQDSPIFSNISIGEHTVTVRDIRGCIESEKTVFVIGYPKFFTPNNDTQNDTWNIIAPSNSSNFIRTAQIFIFDRYGKLLKQLNPLGEGWEGTYNGTEMPSDDYWFTITYNEPTTNLRKKFTAHFALKR